MSKSPAGKVLFLERSWPPPRFWVYFLSPLVVVAIPAPFLGPDYWGGVGGVGGAYLVMVGIAVVWTAMRRWWISSEYIGISRLPIMARIFYGFGGREAISLSEIQKTEVAEGKTRVIRRRAFPGRKPHVKEGLGGTHEKFWCGAAVIVRLKEPDEYGDVALLSTTRPQEAYDALTRAMRAAQTGENERGGAL